MEVSSAFVVVMGMGVTFVGLSCIIFLTLLMGKILSRPEPPKAEPVVPAAPAVPAEAFARFKFVFRFFLYTAKGTAKAVLFAAKKYSI